MTRGLGSGDNGEWTFLDVLTLISFIVGLQNLDMNITQEDMANTTAELDAKVDAKFSRALDEIHSHLELQDHKIDDILNRLEGLK